MRNQHRCAIGLAILAGASLTLIAGSGCSSNDKGKNGEDLSTPAKQPAGGGAGYNNRPGGGGNARPGSPPGPGGAK